MCAAGLMERYQAHIVNFADDFVICCRTGAKEALVWVRQIIGKLELHINESKTHIDALRQQLRGRRQWRRSRPDWERGKGTSLQFAPPKLRCR
jgi:hypothetical protein